MTQLGKAIRDLRHKAGFTLRGFAEDIGISAAHQSDIEHGRRMPSEKVLQDTAQALSSVGATFEGLRRLDSRLESDVQEWVQKSPEVGQMLRRAMESGRSPKDILKQFEELLGEDGTE